MSRPILIDATELVQNPIRTGVQRVVRSLLQHWPADQEFLLCRFKAEGGLEVLPPAVGDLLTERTPEARLLPPAELGHMVMAAAQGRTAPAPAELPVLVPEVFFDAARCAFHRWLCQADPLRVSFLAYDFIPWLRPELLGVRETAPLMHYVRLLRDARRVSFISAATRDAFRARITRDPEAGGPVFPLGGDAPGQVRQHWSPERRTFLCVGSVDGRKNQDVVIDAFEQLWADGIDVRLALVGRVFEGRYVSGLARRIRELAVREDRFTHHEAITDEALAALYARARGTIYVSGSEGFGLPPVESLTSGVPVVVAADMPSIAALPNAGQIRLPRVNARSIAKAVRAMEDDAEAVRLWDGAATVAVPSWSDTAAEVAAWMRQA